MSDWDSVGCVCRALQHCVENSTKKKQEMLDRAEVVARTLDVMRDSGLDVAQEAGGEARGVGGGVLWSVLVWWNWTMRGRWLYVVALWGAGWGDWGQQVMLPVQQLIVCAYAQQTEP